MFFYLSKEWQFQIKPLIPQSKIKASFHQYMDLMLFLFVFFLFLFKFL